METSLSEPGDFASNIRRARIAAGLTQSALAAQAGCKQSAVSMFEGGNRNALAREYIVKIAEILKLEPPAEFTAKDNGQENGTFAALSAAGGAATGMTSETDPQNTVSKPARPLRYCPNFDCPTNHAYQVLGSIYLIPTGKAGEGKHCPYCGEILLAACPRCGAETRNRGACCTECGAALIEFPNAAVPSASEWILRHNETAATLRAPSA